MSDKIEPDKKSNDVPQITNNLLDDARVGKKKVLAEDDLKVAQDISQKSPEVQSFRSKNNQEPQIRQYTPSDLRTAPTPQPERSSTAEPQVLSHGQPQKPSVEFKGLGSFNETGKEPAVARADDGNKPFSEAERLQRSQDFPFAKTPAPQFFLPENLTGQRIKDPDASLVIPPLHTDGYIEPHRGDAADSLVARVKSGDVQPQPSKSQISLGELAAKLNQGDMQKSSSQPSSIAAEAINTKSGEGAQPAQKSSLIPGPEGPRSSGDSETVKPILNSSEQSQHHDILPASPAAQFAPVGSERPLPATPPTLVGSEKPLPAVSPIVLAGQVSSTRDNVHDASPATIANRAGSILPDRAGASDKLRNDVDQKSRIDTSLPVRSTKIDAGKMETIDARTAKTDGPAVPSSGSDLIKSNRTETQSTDKIGKTDKVDATKRHDDIKNRAEISNKTKLEPLIIPGVITSRTSDSGKGSKGTKADGSGKPDTKNPDTKNSDTKNSDTTKVDSKKVDGGSATIKNGGTASDAVSGRKDNIKIDKSDEKGVQRADTKIAASTSNVISGVAGRIVDGLSNIKDKLIPGAKTKVDSQPEKVDSHPEFANHSAQAKPNDAGLGIVRDLKPLLPSANTEFIYNGKKSLSDAREETLSSKTGGLKQALLQIFGNHPDIALDLKANSFPGPKTVPFEKTPDKPGERQTAKLPNDSSRISDKKTSLDTDAAYLRNQKGDKVPTGDLCEQLAELKSNFDQMKPDDAEQEGAAEDADVDSINPQQIKDFTVQLGEIAIGAASVPASEFFTTDDTSELTEGSSSRDDEYDSRYLYYVKEGDTLRSIFDSQLAHEIGNESVFEYFVKTNEQTVRLASVLSADSMSFVLRPGTVLKLPTPREIARLQPQI